MTNLMVSYMKALTRGELKTAIVRDPLVVSPDTPVIDAIAQMSGVRSRCHAQQMADEQWEEIHLEARSSCVIVVADGRVVGILTERDIVRLSAEQQPLEALPIEQVMARSVITLPEFRFTDLFLAINLLQQHHIRHLPVVDEQHRLVGLLTHESLRHLSRPIDLLRLPLVSEVMTADVVCAARTTSMLAIAQLMARHRISSIVIADPLTAGAETPLLPVGIITERDLVQFRALGLNLKYCTAEMVMSTPIFSVKPEESLWIVHQKLEQYRIRRLVVTGAQDELLGIITQSSLLQVLNPLEIYKLAEVLEQRVTRLEAEKVALLESRNAELEKQVESRTAELKTTAEREKLVNQIANRIRSSLNLHAILDTCVTEVRTFLNCDRVLVYQFRADWSGHVVAEAVGAGWRATLHDDIDDPCFRDQVAELYRQGKTVAIDNIDTHRYPQCYRELLAQYQVKANLVVPVIVADNLWGLLIGHQCANYRAWQTTDLRLLDEVAVQLVIAIQQATTYQQLQDELSARQQAEAALRASEAELQGLFAAMDDVVLVMDRAGTFLKIPSTCSPNLRQPFSEMLGRTLHDYLSPDQVPQFLACIHQALDTGTPQSHEYRLTIEGDERWFNAKCSPLSAETVLWVSRDISTELELEQQRALLRTIIDTTPSKVFVKDRDGRYLLANHAIAEFYNTTVDNLVGLRDQDIHPNPEAAAEFLKQNQALIDRQQPAFIPEEKGLAIDGQDQWYQWYKHPVTLPGSNIPAILGIGVNITSYKEAQAAFRMYERVVSATTDGVALLDRHYIYRLVNQVYLDWHDKPREAIIGHSVAELLGEAAFETLVKPRLDRCLTGQVEQYEAWFDYPRGDRRFVRVTYAPYYEEDGTIHGIAVTTHDLTALKQAEIELHHREQFLRGIYEGVEQAIFTVDVSASGEMRFADFNPAAERVMGRSGQELRGHPPGPQVYQHYVDCLVARAAISYEECLVFQDHLTWWLTTLTPIQDATDQIVRIVGTSTEITDRKRAETALQTLTEGTAATTGEDFFPALVRHIAEALGVRHVALCRQTAAGLESLAFWSDGRFRPLSPFPIIADSVCGQALETEDYRLVDGVQTVFSDHPLLAELEVQTYLGIGLRNTDGSAIGALCIFHDRPLPNSTWATALLRIFAARAGAELERYQTAQALETLTQELEQQVAERTASLQASEERWQLALRGSNDAIWDWDVAHHRVFFSSRWKAMRGFADHEIDDRPELWLETIHPDDYGRVMAAVAAHFARETEFFQLEYRVRRKDGTYIWISDRGQALWNEAGQVVRMCGSETDITQRKQAEADRDRLLRFLEASLNEIFVYDAETLKFVYANQGAMRNLGYSLEQLKTLTPADIKPDFDEAAFRALLQPLLAGAQSRLKFETRHQRADGSFYPVEIHLQPHEYLGECFFLAVILDITERQAAEQALRKSEQRYRALMDNASDAILLADCQGNLIEGNQKAEALLGYSQEELTRLHFSQIHPPEVLAAAQLHFNNIVQAGQSIPFETVVLDKEGSQIPVDITGSRIDLNDEQITQGIFRDIRDRKRAEADLQYSRELREVIFNESADALFLVDPATLLTLDCNQRAADLFEVTDKTELIGIEGRTLQRRPFKDAEIREINAEMQAQGFWSLELEYVTRRGRIFWGNIAAKPITVAGQTFNLVRVTDISDRKQAELALQTSESRFRRVFESSVVGMVFADFQGQVLDTNDRFLEIIGYTRADVEAGEINWLTMTPPEYAEIDQQVITQLRQTGVVKPWEKEYYCKDGSRVHVLIGAALLPGTPDQTVCVILDISNRKQLEQSLRSQAEEERLLATITQNIRQSLNLEQILATTVSEVQQTLEADRVLIFRLNPDGSGQVIQEAVVPGYPITDQMRWESEYFPSHCDEYYRQGWPRMVADVANDDWADCPADFMQAAQVKSKMVAPIVRSSRNGPPQVWGLLMVHACANYREWQPSEANFLQKICTQLAIAIDQANLYQQLQQELTERQQAQQQLAESNQQLAISNEELARATRLKDEFLANMSHELRTPLNAILGMTEGLQEAVFGPVTERQLQSLQTIERSGSHLLALINDILDVAKIESGQINLDYTSTNVTALCQSSLAFVKQQALKKRIQLGTSIPPSLPAIWVDERRIRQVLINLLNNAVKFTPDGGRITLMVSRPQAMAGPDGSPQTCLQINVIDTGIGIATEDINKLFQPFIQIDSALNRKYSGTGLGLALVRRIVELHGGAVEVTSEVGVGSCFTITLPARGVTELSPASPEAALPPAAVPHPISPVAAPLILLAEDNEANITTISSYLRAKGYRLLIARNGQAAIALAQTEFPNLILMDVQMPEVDGLTAIQQIRQLPRLADIPIIALTALAMPGDRDRCLAAGANDYLSKPIKMKELLALMQTLLTSQKESI